MSFLHPAVLLGLIAIPLLGAWYARQQSHRAATGAVFVAEPLRPSVAPRSPRWRRHVPMAIFALALALLIVAAARPQRSVAEPVTNGSVMLADDVSGSMAATDVKPSREGAARHAGKRFVQSVPGSVEVGMLVFSRLPTVLQSPSADHALTDEALSRHVQFGGGTAIGEAILAAVRELKSVPKVGGKRPPGAIVLISDGTSNVGIGPVAAARQAKADHIPVYTVSVGTAHGTITVKRRKGTVNVPVPVSRGELAEIAKASGGSAFQASDSAGVDAAYERLAAHLGRREVKQEITAGFAGGGMALLLVGGALSLVWLGRLV